MLTVTLNEDGSESGRTFSDSFFDSDESPVFERPALGDGVAYFPAFDGKVHPVVMNGSTAVPMAPWSLIGPDESTWAPAGIEIDGEDDLGRIYFLMNPEANGVEVHTILVVLRSGCLTLIHVVGCYGSRCRSGG